MRSTPTSDSALPGQSPTTARRRARRATGLAALATLSVLGPGAYVTTAIVTAPPAFAAKKKKKNKHHCKKGFVYQHGKCRASSRPVY
jgi:hypothetical protein